MEENKKRTKTIGDQFSNELSKLAVKTEKEIQQMHDDYVEMVKGRSGKQPELFAYLETYDNMIITVIQNLLNIRRKKRFKHLKRRIAELERRKKKD